MTEKFNSRGKFVLASVGAAVGLGNALRFPGLCAKYGGGAFLCVYILGLLLLGIPLLNAEIALGRKVRGAAPECFKSLFKGGDKLGWAQSGNSALCALLYSGLAGWILCEAFYIIPQCINGGEQNYFFHEILRSGGDGVITGISPAVCVCLLLVWLLAFFCLKNGAEGISKAARFSVFVPIVLLSAMSVRGLFYPSSGTALKALFTPDFSRLNSPELWINALGQVFFSLSLSVGIMPAYGSYLPERVSIFPATLIIAAADCAVSILASVALFTSLYGCGAEGLISSSGLITAFSVYPEAIKNLFSSPILCSFAGVSFYLSLTLMAVQSGCSMLEAFLSPVIKKFGLKRKKAAGACCAAGFLLSLIFATTAGDKVVEISDKFINFYNVLALCIAECLALGLTKGGRGLGEEVNRYSSRLKLPEKFFRLSVCVLCPLTLFLLLPQFAGIFSATEPAWAYFLFGWGTMPALISLGFLVDLLSRERVIKGQFKVNGRYTFDNHAPE